VVLYGSFHRALIVSGWFGEPKDEPAKPAGDDAPKN